MADFLVSFYCVHPDLSTKTPILHFKTSNRYSKKQLVAVQLRATTWSSDSVLQHYVPNISNHTIENHPRNNINRSCPVAQKISISREQ